MEKGLLVILSGPSGAGKGTVLNEVKKQYKNLAVSVSVTTRLPREGEVDGVNYHFKTIEEYHELVRNDEFLETQKVFDNYYGTLKSEVFSKIEKGFDVVLEIDVKGALKVKESYNDVVSIFICPTSIEELKRRLAGRGSESEETLKLRLSGAIAEIQTAEKYDYVVVNNDIQECANDIISIIKKEKNSQNVTKEIIENAHKCETKNNMKFIEELINGGNEND